MNTTVKMVGSKFVVEIALAEVMENFGNADKLTLEVTQAQVIQAVKDAAPKPPVAGAAKPGPKPQAKTPATA